MSSERAPISPNDPGQDPKKALAAKPGEDIRLRVRVGDKGEDLSYQQAFVLGHKLLKRREFGPAVAIFEKLAGVPNRGPRAHIMLAIGRAGLSQYAAAHAVLNRAPSFQPSLAAAVYDVIVLSRMGFKEDALHDLVEMVNEHKELPTLCLWLGDMLEANQQVDKAAKCWQLAQRRDQSGGAVAAAADRQLRLLTQNRGSSASSEPGKT